MTGKVMSQLKGWHLPACCTRKSKALAWHHNLWGLMLEASCSLELSDIVLTKCRNVEETEEGMTSASSKDASSSAVLPDYVRIVSRPCSKSSMAWSKKSNPCSLAWVRSGLMWTPYPWNQDKCVSNNNKTEGPLSPVPMVSVSVLPNCPCFYREFLWVWCHCMTSFREKVLCKIAQLPIGQFYLPWCHMTCCYFAWLWLVDQSHMTLLNYHCSVQLDCLHQVVLVNQNKIILVVKVFSLNRINSLTERQAFAHCCELPQVWRKCFPCNLGKPNCMGKCLYL